MPGQASAQSRAGGESAGCFNAQESAMHERIRGGPGCCCRSSSGLPSAWLACLQKRIDGLERGGVCQCTDVELGLTSQTSLLERCGGQGLVTVHTRCQLPLRSVRHAPA